MEIDEMVDWIPSLLQGDPACTVRFREAKHHILVVTIEASGRPGEEGRRRVDLKTGGVEEFYMVLDGRYEYREFEYDPIRQRVVISEIVEVAKAYLRGDARVVHGGPFLNQGGTFQINVGQMTYAFAPISD